MPTAVVVGSGPNGLAGAVALARAGVSVTVFEAADEIGGGTRTVEGIVPGLLHDLCSAVHPMAVGSPFLRALELDRHGLRWLLPDIDCAHPLDDGRAGVLHRDVSATAEALGPDGPLWTRLFGGPSRGYDELAEDVLRPLLRAPRHPLRMARFGLPALFPAATLARRFTRDTTRALFAGVAAHAYRPLEGPMSAAIGLGILTAGHRHGWAVAAGGSRAITDALAAELRAQGGRIETGVRVRSASGLPPADTVLLDVDPAAAADILGDRLPPRIAAAYRRFRRGPGAFKVDFAVHGGVPWTARDARRAGTVHLGGPLAEILHAERAIHAGRLPERPFVLVGQQYLADPSRSVGDVHPVWTYAHVPHGFDGDTDAVADAIVARIEQFAPGFRERVVGRMVRTPAATARENPNFAGGDIMTGAKDVLQLLAGPRPTVHPYDTGVPGVYLCSAATPPGPGAHGMCGANAAAAALARLRAGGRRSTRVVPDRAGAARSGQ